MMRTTLLHNSAALVAGRLVLSIGRLGAAILVTRLAGTETFGSYALLLSVIGLFEWLVDFGQTDIAARDVAQHPGRAGAELAALTRAKVVMALIVGCALPLGLALLAYPLPIVIAGAVGSVSIAFTAALQPARVRVRARMRIDLDVGAEIVGLVVMVPLLAIAAATGSDPALLIATYAIARAVQWAVLSVWGRTTDAAVRSPSTWDDTRRLARSAAPLGAAGLLVVLYDALAPLMLSKLLDLHAVALYAAAARFVFPVVIVVQAINNAFFVALSATWARDRTRFAEMQQTALTLSVCVAGVMFTGIHGASDFLMGLLGRDFLAGAPVLRLLAWVLLLRAVTTAMSPLIVVAGYQTRAMWLTLGSVAMQVAALLVLVPRLGVAGAAVSYLVVELTLGTVAVSVIGQIVAGIQMDWRRVLLMLAPAAGVVAAIRVSPLHGGFAAGLIAPAAFLLACVLSGALSPARVRDMRRTLGHVPALEAHA